MLVVMVEPNRKARITEIGDSLKEHQQIVGGHIDVVYPFQDDPVGCVCNEEGKLLHLPLNRSLGNYDIIAGTFFVCGLGEEDFTSLTPELAEKYQKEFDYPETFFLKDGGIVAVKIKT